MLQMLNTRILFERMEKVAELGKICFLHSSLIVVCSGSGLLEFTEFCHLASWFLKEEDEETLLKELKEAFRIYDKDEAG